MMIFPAIRAFSRIGFPAVNLSLVGCARKETHWARSFQCDPSGRDFAKSFWNFRSRGHLMVMWLPWLYLPGKLAGSERSAGCLLMKERKRRNHRVPGMPASIDRRLGG